MKKFFLFITLFGLCLTSYSCSSADSNGVSTDPTDSMKPNGSVDPNNTMNSENSSSTSDTAVSETETFSVCFIGNPTTGYTWEYEIISGADCVKVSVAERDVTEHTSEPNMAGNARLEYTFIVSGAASGTAELRFFYAQSWNKGDAAESHIYKITVDGENNVVSAEERDAE